MWPIFFSLLNDHDVLPLINLLIWFVVQVTVVARSRCAGPGVLIPVSFVVQAIDTGGGTSVEMDRGAPLCSVVVTIETKLKNMGSLVRARRLSSPFRVPPQPLNFLNPGHLL
jgi:hypothetical protein